MNRDKFNKFLQDKENWEAFFLEQVPEYVVFLRSTGKNVWVGKQNDWTIAYFDDLSVTVEVGWSDEPEYVCVAIRWFFDKEGFKRGYLEKIARVKEIEEATKRALEKESKEKRRSQYLQLKKEFG